jgi:hypothetical protein
MTVQSRRRSLATALKGSKAADFVFVLHLVALPFG